MKGVGETMKRGVLWRGDPMMWEERVIRMMRPATWTAREWESFLAVVATDYEFLLWTPAIAIVNLSKEQSFDSFRDGVEAVVIGLIDSASE